MQGHQFSARNENQLRKLISICQQHKVNPVVNWTNLELVVMQSNMSPGLLTSLVNSRQYNEYRSEDV